MLKCLKKNNLNFCRNIWTRGRNRMLQRTKQKINQKSRKRRRKRTMCWRSEFKRKHLTFWFVCLHFHRKAIEELQREICINKVKRKTFGSVTVPKARTNKRFLATTLNQCLSHNKRQSSKHQVKSTEQLKKLERNERLKNSKQKFGERKHEYKKPAK